MTEKFYREFQEHHAAFLELIENVGDERQRRSFASVLLTRLMFVYFLQRRGFLRVGQRPQTQDDLLYLQKKLEATRRKGQNLYYREFLQKLFFVGLAKPDEDEEKQRLKNVLGDVPCLGGGLFLRHKIELDNPHIQIPDQAFAALYKLFAAYSWNLDDTPDVRAGEINPHVLGYIFEKYLNRKAFGAYYTRPEITRYLCEQTIHRLILARVKALNARRYESVPDLLTTLDASLCRLLLDEVLPNLKLLDPACGSAAFLSAAMRTLLDVYSAVTDRIEFLDDANLKSRLDKLRREHHGSLEYFIKRRIITDNLFGVDIMEESVEIAKLILFLALVAPVGERAQLASLPDIDFNIRAGNALIGLMHVDEHEFERRNVRDARAPQDEIERTKREVNGALNEILLGQFTRSGIKFEQAVWDGRKNRVGKPRKRAVGLPDIEALRPFHWGFEFAEIIGGRGGFDAVITNPPWEVFKPIAKEFCYDRDPSVGRRGTSIEDFEKKLIELLKTPENRARYVEYLSGFPHVSAYLRQAGQYENQISVIDGKKIGTDINLYKLFLEQCFNLLRDGGECGIVLPSGVYSDLGARPLREMLFARSKINGLFCFENRREIFAGVHRNFKFAVLTLTKEGETKKFPAAFMRHELKDLERFPAPDGMQIDVELIRRLSPTSLSLVEFKNNLEVAIAEKMAKFPLLGERLDDNWNISLTREFDMTNDSGLFKRQPARKRLPLYEGRMIRLFAHAREAPRYWIDEDAGRIKLLSPRLKAIRKLLAAHELGPDDFDAGELIPGYQSYRLGFRAVTGATNERALVASVIPQNVFCGNSLVVSVPFVDEIVEDGRGVPKWTQRRMYTPAQLLACASLLGSYVCDWFVRQKILTNMNMFYVYELPVPRLNEKDAAFAPVVERAAKLICTAPEFDELARAAGPGRRRTRAPDEAERARLRAELDGLIARLYGLTEDEFAYILTTFPLVPETVKTAALNAHRASEGGFA